MTRRNSLRRQSCLSKRPGVNTRDGQYLLAVMILRGTERDETYAVRIREKNRSNEVALTVLALPVFQVRRQTHEVELEVTGTKAPNIKLGNMKMVTQNFREEARDMVTISDSTTEDTVTIRRIKEITVA